MNISDIITFDNIQYAIECIILPLGGYVAAKVRKINKTIGEFEEVASKVEGIKKSIEHAERKHVATIHALQITFKNGFYDAYTTKLKELDESVRYL